MQAASPHNFNVYSKHVAKLIPLDSPKNDSRWPIVVALCGETNIHGAAVFVESWRGTVYNVLALSHFSAGASNLHFQKRFGVSNQPEVLVI